MSKINKAIVTIIGMLILIFGIATISEAYTFDYRYKNGTKRTLTVNNVGERLSLSLDDYEATNQIYCIQKDQQLNNGDYRTYTVVGKVSIVGNTATGHNGKSVTNNLNGKLAYILNHTNNAGLGNFKEKDRTPVPNAIWNNIHKWVLNIGNTIGVPTITNNNPGDFSPGRQLEIDAEVYASNIQDQGKIEDKTNHKRITVNSYTRNGADFIRVGPFKFNFSNKINELTVHDQDGKTISGVQISSFNGNTESFFGSDGIVSGRDFYVSIPSNQGVSKLTKIRAKSKSTVYTSNIWFLNCDRYTHQNLMIHEPGSSEVEAETEIPTPIDLMGDLKVIKVDKDNNTYKLQGVGFRIQRKSSGKWVRQNADGTISYVDGRENGTEFVTDKNGEILIKDLLVDTYVAFETKNPNYGYEIIKEGIEQKIVVEKTTDFKIENKRKWIKLSGYVWVDQQSGKQSLRNDLLKDNDLDDRDIMMNNTVVRLKDRRTGETVMEGRTRDGGEYESGYYQFIDVLVDEIQNYYIEFEYDGLTYTNVVPHLDKSNGSKSAETPEIRKAFNENFSKVEGGDTESTGITRDVNDNKVHDLSYNLDKVNHTSSVINNGQYAITANTDATGYSIKTFYQPGEEELKYINLGLYEREMPSTALAKDLENVILTINGYEHTYKYATRSMSADESEELNGFNVGVKFGGRYPGMKYTRAIYKSDYTYINEQDKSKELQSYLIYKIGVKNQSTHLTTRVNRLTDYFDSRYELQSVGRQLDEQGRVVPDNGGQVSIAEQGTTGNGTYKTAQITLSEDIKIAPQSVEYVYVQFKLSREAIQNILDTEEAENLRNVAEIDSYSVFDENGEVYAGIDKHSNPENVNPADATTYQPDTDTAPAFQLETKDAYSRELSGTVFVDETTGELRTGEVRQGSGAYEEGERTIEGVKVTLRELTTNSNVEEVSTTTDANGNFKFINYIPGEYEIIYTWGDKEYTVQNYKGTVYDKDRYTNNMNNKWWHEQEALSPRFTDAVDDYNQRLAIDEELKKMTHETESNATITTMDATTPVMDIRIEKGINSSIETESDGNELIIRNKTEHLDFGIVERPRQDIELTKRVKSLKVTLANGQVISDVTIVNGRPEGQTANLTYMAPDATGNGFVRVEMDSELLQGSVLEVTYEITATNQSELEYNSQDFYTHGIQVGNVVTLRPTEIVDYLDNGWAFDADKNAEWTVRTIEELKEKLKESVYNGSNENATIDEKTIFTTEALNKDLRPGESTSVDLNVSKILTSTDEISLDNEVEVLEIDREYGRITTSTPGNYTPGTGNTEPDDSTAETVIVTPNTGENRNFIIQIAVGLSALIILGAGVVIIRKTVLKK